MSTDDSPLLFRQASRRVPRGPLREFLGEISRRVARGRGVVCLITDDRELRRLNRQFRGKDYATDVLSFPAGNAGPDCRASKNNGVSRQVRRDRQGVRSGSDNPLGEIAISIDRAAAQAAEYDHSLADELRILMLHGALHLAGFDHETDSGEMRRVEARWRKRLGLPPGLIERRQVQAPIQPRQGRARS